MINTYTQQFLTDLSSYHAEASARRKTKSKPYIKPDSVRRLELAHMEHQRQQHPDIPFIAKKSFRDDTANGLTECVIEWLRLHGFFAARVNTTGIYRQDLGRYIRSGSTRGMADVNSVINGKSVSVEIKAGKDRPRAAQLLTAEAIRNAGGHYLFVRSFDDFLEQIRPIAEACSNTIVTH